MSLGLFQAGVVLTHRNSRTPALMKAARRPATAASGRAVCDTTAAARAAHQPLQWVEGKCAVSCMGSMVY